ncbi:hypothetical protein ACIGNX_22805 [Actinosynnema sp. NPDC053489]|uniref:hypothetical protein n=1 Tax=Actinosynnema sp. NPDC053489 TaxID=3363916 RepID=UPI0037CAF22C
MRGFVVTVLAGLVLAGCAQRPAETGPPATTGAEGVTSVPVTPGKLGPSARGALDRARRDGASTVGLTVSTERDRAAEVAEGLRGLGATVESTDTAVGYVRATVPIEAVARVPAVAGVSRVDVDEPLSNGDPTP